MKSLRQKLIINVNPLSMSCLFSISFRPSSSEINVTVKLIVNGLCFFRDIEKCDHKSLKNSFECRLIRGWTRERVNDIGNEWPSKKTSNERKNEGKSKRTSDGMSECLSDRVTGRLCDWVRKRMWERLNQLATMLLFCRDQNK